MTKKGTRTANRNGRSDPVFHANLEAFASIGLVPNDYISGICHLDHVTPAYILGQKNRLQSERRYSPGLLLTVIQCKDALPEKYTICDSTPPLSPIPSPLNPSDVFGAAPKLNSYSAAPQHRSPHIEPDPSIHEPISSTGMTAARAWSAALQVLRADMPKSSYDRWVKDTVLLSARDGTFLIGAPNAYARDWLESRLTSTITQLLAGIRNQSVEVRFVEINELEK